MNYFILALKPSNIALEVHDLMPELADIGPSNENLLVRESEGQAFPQGAQILAAGGHVGFSKSDAPVGNRREHFTL
jgi:hypothetical protein